MKGSDSEQAEQFGKVMDISGNIMKPANDVLALRKTTVPEYELEEAAYVLAKRATYSQAILAARSRVSLPRPWNATKDGVPQPRITSHDGQAAAVDLQHIESFILRRFLDHGPQPFPRLFLG